MSRIFRCLFLLLVLWLPQQVQAGEGVWSYSEGNPDAAGTATHHRASVQTSEGWGLLFLPPDQYHFQLLIGFPGKVDNSDFRLDAYFAADPARDRTEKTETLEFAAGTFQIRYLETSGQSILYLPVRRGWVNNLSSADELTLSGAGKQLTLPMGGSAKAIAELYAAIERDGIGREYPSNAEARQFGEAEEPSGNSAQQPEAGASPQARLDLVDGRFVSISRDEDTGDILFALELINPVESNGTLTSIKITLDEKGRDDGESITIRLPELTLASGESKTYTIRFKEEYNRLLYNILWRGAVEGRLPRELALGIYGMEGIYSPASEKQTPRADAMPDVSGSGGTDMTGVPVRTAAEKAAFREWLDAD